MNDIKVNKTLVNELSQAVKGDHGGMGFVLVEWTKEDEPRYCIETGSDYKTAKATGDYHGGKVWTLGVIYDGATVPTRFVTTQELVALDERLQEEDPDMCLACEVDAIVDYLKDKKES